MTASASVSRLGSEFDDFLFAPIGAEGNGMLLSVLSALARLDIDPWQEAAELARLPTETAIRKLAALIAGSTESPSIHLDPSPIAARLIALLPRPSAASAAPREAVVSVPGVINTRGVVFVISGAIFLALMIGSQFIIASHQTPAQAGNASAPTAATVSLETSPPNPRR
jgi:hypothetical protein